MTTTVNLLEGLLARGVRHQKHGQFRSAIRILRQLATFLDASPEMVGEAHDRVGEMYLRRRRYRLARTHLRCALTQQTDSARTHFLLGLAWHHDPAGCAKRASAHYQESLKLSPRQPICLAEAGLLVVSSGDGELGLRLLRNAQDMAPNDPRVLRRVVRGLLLAGFPDEALKAAREARFRAPRSRRLREAYTEIRLALTRRDQDTAKADAEPVILPFLRVVGESVDEACPVREDGAEPLPGPHLVRMRSRRGRRRAP